MVYEFCHLFRDILWKGSLHKQRSLPSRRIWLPWRFGLLARSRYDVDAQWTQAVINTIRDVHPVPPPTPVAPVHQAAHCETRLAPQLGVSRQCVCSHAKVIELVVGEPTWAERSERTRVTA